MTPSGLGIPGAQAAVASTDPRDFLLAAQEFSTEIEQLTDEDYDKLSGLLMEVAGLVCNAVGHHVVKDHCGKPEHDFCIYCRQIRPGEAKERNGG